jgi:hypothetical protein
MTETPGVPHRLDDQKPIGVIADPGRPRGEAGVAQLRLYIAASTPNSVRAEQHLAAALTSLGDLAGDLDLDVIDVFVNGKRAIHDGVIVTPTLIVVCGPQRFMIVGDMLDSALLRSMLVKTVSGGAAS